MRMLTPIFVVILLVTFDIGGASAIAIHAAPTTLGEDHSRGVLAAPTAFSAPDFPFVAWAQDTADDLDCEDFETLEEAQAVFEEDPTDPHNLDPNGDGVACGLLPSEADLEQGRADGAESQQAAEDDPEQSRAERRAARQAEQGNAEEPQEDPVLTCADFASQEDAQMAFDEDPGGLADLDSDGNGIACEEILEVAPDDDTAREERRQNRRNRDQENQEEEPAEVDVVVDEPRREADVDVVVDEPRRERDLPKEDLDCIDFDFQEEAQEIYNSDPTDPFNLDPNGDGFACSSLPLRQPLISQVPRTGSGSLALPSAPALFGLFAGLAAVASGAVIRRRRTA